MERANVQEAEALVRSIRRMESIPIMRTAAPDLRNRSSIGWERILPLLGGRCFPRGVDYSSEMWRDGRSQVGPGTRTSIGIKAMAAGPPPSRSFRTTELAATGDSPGQPSGASRSQPLFSVVQVSTGRKRTRDQTHVISDF
jgi:hypothetical protein